MGSLGLVAERFSPHPPPHRPDHRRGLDVVQVPRRRIDRRVPQLPGDDPDVHAFFAQLGRMGVPQPVGVEAFGEPGAAERSIHILTLVREPGKGHYARFWGSGADGKRTTLTKALALV